MTRPAWALALGLLLVAGAPSFAAADEPSKWQFEFLPYAWLPGSFGTVNVRGRTAVLDTTVRDGIELATSGNAWVAGGYFSASYDRWSTFVDAFGGYENESAAEKIPTKFCTLCVAATAKIRPVLVDFAVGYRLGQWSLPKRQQPLTLGVFAGMAYVHFGTSLSGSLGPVGGAIHSSDVATVFNWADPMIGVRWEVPLVDRVTLHFRGDIGGFGVSSQLIWGLIGDARYWLPWKPWSIQLWLDAGYRAAAFDRHFGEGNSINLQFRGPYGGLGFLF
jgi:hypothetical protein